MFILAADWVKFFGRLHPLFVHLPIGIILATALIYLLSNRDRWKFLQISLNILLFISALTASLSVLAGFSLIRGESYNPSTINLHKWFGIGTAILAWISWIIFKSDKSRAWKHFGIISLVLIMVVSGHYGGQITHGKQYLSQYAPGFLAPVLGTPVKAVNYTLKESEMDSAAVFQHIIYPILEAKCIKCHNEQKSNGDLRLDRYEEISKGGSSGEVLHEDPMESTLFARTTLSQTSVKFMPPEGIPLTYKEQLLLAWWLELGYPEKTKMRPLEIPKEILGITEELYGYSHKPKSFVEKNNVEPADSNELTLVNASVFDCKPIAANTNFLEVNTKTDIKELTTEQIQKLIPLQNQLSWLSFPNKNIRDEHLREIGKFHSISKLKIQENSITDQGIEYIRQLDNLEVLNVYGNEISNECIPALGALKNLRQLYVWKTNIDTNGVRKLQLLLPNTEIVSGMDL